MEQAINKYALIVVAAVMIVGAALERETVGILLSNNILPSTNILSKAEETGMPIMLMPGDTFKVVKQVDDLETLFTADEADKIKLLAEAVEEHVDSGAILK